MQTLGFLEPKTSEDDAILSDRAAVKGLALADLARLSRKRLGEKDTLRIAGSAKASTPEEARTAGLVPLTILVASQTTTDFLMDEIAVAGLRQGFLFKPLKTDFNPLADLAFGDYFDAPGSAEVDYTLIGLDYRQLGFRHDLAGDAEAAEKEVQAKLMFVRQVVDAISAKTRTPCIIQNLVAQPQYSIATIDRNVAGSPEWQVETFNRGLADYAAESGHLVLDLAGLAAWVGLSNWHDRGMWFMAKMPFAQSVAPLFAHRLSVLIAAARGKSKKVLVLDLDNTVWGGVIGDDGVTGIVLGQGSAAGEAFLDIHKLALMLKSRGVVLAVSSKNTESIAADCFTQHPETLLRLDDFAVFRANWDDKASNISHIAKTLDLGLDSIVFLDDNPVERALVRRTLPQVAVPEVGLDASEYPSILISAGYFESLTVSEEDRKRAAMYRDNAKRVSQMEQIGDLSAYLNSLEMVMTVGPVGDKSRERVVQLINKSNQFNLTTKRYSIPEMMADEADPDTFTLQVRLKDSFGDNGIIGVNVCRAEGDDWLLDTWLMSCRVLKRRAEEQVLQHIVAEARERGVKRLHGVFIPSGRNELVRGLYESLGFVAGETTDDGTQHWWLDVEAYEPKDLPLTLEKEA